MKKLDESKIFYIDDNSDVQEIIDSQPKDLGSFELIFLFKDGIHNLNNGLVFSDFSYGNIYVQGNIFFPRDDKNRSIIKCTSPIITIQNCMANIFIRYLDLIAVDYKDDSCIIYADGTRDFDVKRNKFIANKCDGLRLFKGRHRIWNNKFNDCNIALSVGMGASVITHYNESYNVDYSYSNDGGALNILEGDEICGQKDRFFKKHGKIREFKKVK